MPNKKNITIIKANGEKEQFKLEKVVTSLKRSGATRGEIKGVVEQLIPQLQDNMTTSQIYSIVFSLLHQREAKGVAGRYSLKKAIFDLGPTGYPFEQYLAGLFEEMGYETKTNQIIQGGCIEHEMDIVCKRGDEEIFVESKFHANQGYKTNIKTALYVWGRFLDITNARDNTPKPWLMTNTKLTTEVIKYAKCVGMHVVSWNYPNGGSLREIVDKSSLHPITSLRTLDSFTKENLLRSGVVFCKDIKNHPDLFKNKDIYNKVLEEAKYLVKEPYGGFIN